MRRACGRSDPGAARRADVHHPLALGGKRGARAAAFPRRPKGGAAARAHGSGRPDRGDLPDQLACAENLVGEREIPDHPLVGQTIADCLNDAMDIAGLEALLRRLEAGAIRIVPRDLTEPSPLALEVLSARPYAYLDDAPLEERRTQAVMSRRWLAPEEGRPRPARSRGDRARAGRSLARAGERGRTARRACLARVPERGRYRRGLAGTTGWRRWRASGVTRLHGPSAMLWVAAERLRSSSRSAGSDARSGDRRPGGA